jgi:hypothetical protein
MRRVLRPATLVFAAVLVSLAACSSPTAPAPATVKIPTAPATRDDADVPPTDRSGIVLPHG